MALLAGGSPAVPLDPAELPRDRASQYAVFAVKCSKCHTLDRPLQASLSDDQWRRYVKKMTRRPGSGINEETGALIVDFLVWLGKRGAAPTERLDRAPEAAALPALLRALGYDRSMAARPAGDLVVLVAGDPAARAWLLALEAGAPHGTVQGRPVRLVELDKVAALAAAKEETGAMAVLFTDGVSDEQVKAAVQVAHRLGLYTLAIDPRLSPFVVLSAEQSAGHHLKPVVNATAAAAVGADFERTLLQAAHVIQ